MSSPAKLHSLSCSALWPCVLLASVVALVGCKKLHHTDLTPLDQAGMYFNSVEQLRQLGVTEPEVAQLVPARQAGLTDQTCIALVQIVHGRHEQFNDGQAVAGLLGAGLEERSVLELERLDQLGLWSGEAQAMRLSGLSDQVILAVAMRRAAHQPVVSSPKVTALQNAGLSEKQILADIDGGITDSQADAVIAERTNAAGGHGFVRQRGRRR
jgi:hypothetical protein